MTQGHLITPPPELVQEWIKDANHNKPMFAQVAVTAARWGADQELEACCEWVSQFDYDDLSYGDRLRAARRGRTTPPSLKEQALEAAQRFYANGHEDCSDEEIKDDND